MWEVDLRPKGLARCTPSQMVTAIAPSLAPPERVEQQYPIRALATTGATLSFGSDWPVRVCCAVARWAGREQAAGGYTGREHGEYQHVLYMTCSVARE